MNKNPEKKYNKETLNNDKNEKDIKDFESFSNLINAEEIEIEDVANKEIDDVDQITEKLKALGAGEVDITEVLSRTKKIDENIEEEKGKTLANFYDALDTFYKENFQYVGKSVLAEIRMRPIYKKYINLDLEIYRIYLKEEKRKKKNPNADLSDLDPYNVRKLHFNSASHLFDCAEDFKKIPEFVKKEKYNETNIKDIKTYQDNLRYRRDSLSSGELRYMFKYSCHEENEWDILKRLYAIQLNQIREKFKNNDDNIKENLDIYFRPAVNYYTDEDHHQVFSEKKSSVNNSGYLISVVSRIEAFTKAIENDSVILSERQKIFLKEKVLDIFEKSKDDIACNISGIQHLESIIDLCDFSGEQKEYFNSLMFNAMLNNKSRHFFNRPLDNPNFPYTEEQKEKIFNILVNSELNAKGVNIYYKEKKSKNGYDTIGIEKLNKFPFSNEQKEKIGQVIMESVLREIEEKKKEGDYKYLASFFSNNSLPVSEAQHEVLRESARVSFFEAAENFINFCRALENADSKNMSNFNIASVSGLIQLLQKFGQDKEKTANLINKIPWNGDIIKMLDIQKRTSRAEYDPWITDLNPLVQESIKSESISLGNPKDGKIILDYVKKIGPKNLTNYFSLFAKISRCDSVDNMSSEIKIEINESFGVNVDEICKKDPTNLNLILNEIEKIRINYFKDLLNENVDTACKLVESSYGKEFLLSFIGTSGFGHGADNGNVLKIHREALLSNPELFKLAEGYNETTIEVSEYASGTETDNEDKQQQIDLLLKNSELKIYYSKIFNSIENTKENKTMVEMLAKFDIKIIEDFKNELETINKKITEENKNEKAVENLLKRKNILKSQEERFNLFSMDSKKQNLGEVMESYFDMVPDNFISKQELLMNLSLEDMENKFPEQISKLKDRELVNQSPSVDSVNIFSEFIQTYVGEHYLNKKHGQQDSINSSNKDLQKYLKKVWGTQDFEKGIMAISRKKLDFLEKGELSGKKKTIDLVPSKGMMRMFSGDLGKACTSGQNIGLAKGEYPGITSFSFVLDKDTSRQRFAGSFLVVETKTDKGEPILVLRANNPAQNLSQMVDPQELVQKVIDEVKNIAKRKNISKVGIIYDGSSSASSNRPFVSEYYKKNFSIDNSVALVDTPETNFNGYDIHNINKGHPVVLV